MPNVMMASVVMDGTGKLGASVNPTLDPKQQLVLACQCAQLFAQLAAQMAVAQDAEAKPQILVPRMTGVKL